VTDPAATATSGSSGGRGGAPEGIGLRAAAGLLAASALLSRILGYVRDAVLANQVGAGAEADAYFAAFMVPDILNYLLAGGALAIAFMPLYNRVRANRGGAEAEHLFATILGTLGVVVVAVTILLWIFADVIVALFFPAMSEETRELTVHLSRIVLPAQIFFVTGGVMRAVLMAHGNFTAQAIAPVCYNGFVIAGGIATGTVEGFAWGVLIGAGTGTFLFPMLQLARRGQLSARVAFFDGDFRTYLWLALPLMLGPFIAFCVMVGLQWSIKSKGTIGAVIAAVAIVLAIVGVISLCAIPAGDNLSFLGAVLSTFSPVNLLFAVVFPDKTIPDALSDGVFTARWSLVIGAALAAIAYAAISYGMHTNMKRTFMMTVRRLAGTGI
jgi:putative peptidoglycan lipid II flippase